MTGRGPRTHRGAAAPDAAPGAPAVAAPVVADPVTVVLAGVVVAVVMVAGTLALGGGAGGGDGGSGGGGRGDDGDVALVAGVDRRGSFSVPCDLSHSAPDDPIVHRDHHGRSHRHDFFGATTTEASSTAATLVAGGTTCRSVFDKSAYWVPALLAGGRPVEPTRVVAYYRTPVGVDARQVAPPPNGLEMVAGDATADEAQDPSIVRWSCGVAGDASPVPPHCPARAELRVRVTFAPCWDGENLRAADHVGHLARLPGTDEQRAVTGAACPASHPVLLPEITLEVRYREVPGGALGLASGWPTGGHGDVLVAWDRAHLAAEVDICLRRNLSCDVVSEPGRLGPA